MREQELQIEALDGVALAAELIEPDRWQGGVRQSEAGIDLAAGVRYQSVGFSPDSSKVEFLLAGGRRFGSFELMVDSILGFELKGPGRDFEFKSFAGYRINDAVRAGMDGRIAAEFIDEEGTKTPQATDLDEVAGPAVSWLFLQDRLHLQALAGAVKPKGTPTYAAGGFLYASYDF